MIKFFSKSLLILFWIQSVVNLFVYPEGFSSSYFRYIIISVLISTVSFILYLMCFYNKRFFFSITILFILGILIVNFQIPLLYSINQYFAFPHFDSFYWADMDISSFSISVSYLALTSYFFGFILYELFTIKKENNIPIKINFYRFKLVLFLAYLFYILFLINSGSYLVGLYDFTTASSFASYFIAFFDITAKALIIITTYFIYNKIDSKSIDIFGYIKKFDPYLVFLVLVHVSWSLFVGDRGPVIIYLILLFGPYLSLKLNKKYFVFIFLSSIIILPTFFSIIGALRTRSSDNNIIERFNSINFNEYRLPNYFKDPSDVYAISTIELALSGRALNHVIANVPKNHEYGNGWYQINHLVNIIPFLSGIIQSYIYNYNSIYDGSPSFITYLIQGRNPTYGDGTNTIADIYIDFGPYAVLPFFIFAGIFFRNLDNIMYNRTNTTLFYWLCYAFIISGAIYLSRSSFGYMLQRIFQIYIIILFIREIPFKRIRL